MKNDMAKVKKETTTLPESVIAKYIRMFNLGETDTPRDEDSRKIMFQTIRREFLFDFYGGNPQELFSVPKADRAEQHGHKLFVCPMLSIHPWAPQMPGFPGLVFNCPPRSYDQPWIDSEAFILIAGLQPGKWLYIGHYKWRGHGWLTKEEWRNLSRSVKRDWINYIMVKPFGISLRMSIRLRRRLGREPSYAEVCKESEKFKPRNARDDVTEQDVMDAYNSGKEAIRITGLACELYDFELQREFVEKQEEWLRGDGAKFSNGQAFKSKRKRKAVDRDEHKDKKKRRRQPREIVHMKEEDEVSEYDADRTSPPAR